MGKWSKFLYRLNTDEKGVDKLEDKYAGNTYLELMLRWIAVMLTALVILMILGLVAWYG